MSTSNTSLQLLNVTELANSSASNVSNEKVLEAILEFIKPQFYQWIYLALFTIVFIVGITGNFLVCYSVWKSRSLKSVTNYFLVNLAAADFLVILFCLPASIIFDTIQSWFLGLAMCKLFVYVQVSKKHSFEKKPMSPNHECYYELRF